MGQLRVALLLGIAACGRLGFDDESAKPTPPTPAIDNKTPMICGTSDWTTATAAYDDDLSVAVTPTGVALFSAPASSGAIHGAMLDHAQLLQTTGVVRTGMFTASAAAYVDSTLIAAGVSSSRVIVNIVPEDLTSYSEIANVDGMMVGKQALMHASADRITPTACSAGLTINPFTLAWAAIPSQLAVTTDQSTGIAATPIGHEALVAWSTMSGSCHVERVMDDADGVGSSQTWECKAPRLAYDAASTTSTLLFEVDDGIHLASIANDTLSSGSMLAVAGARSPRILNDGTRTWIAYLDTAGDLQVGTFGFDGAIQTIDTSVRPTHDAFELAIVDGELWVYAINAGHYEATHVCLQ